MTEKMRKCEMMWRLNHRKEREKICPTLLEGPEEGVSFFPHNTKDKTMRFSLIATLTLLPGLASALSSVSDARPSSLKDFDFNTADRLPWIEQGYETWKWRGNDINYIEMGDKSKPALVLIHGFGASSYHWRYNIVSKK